MLERVVCKCCRHGIMHISVKAINAWMFLYEQQCTEHAYCVFVFGGLIGQLSFAECLSVMISDLLHDVIVMKA